MLDIIPPAFRVRQAKARERSVLTWRCVAVALLPLCLALSAAVLAAKPATQINSEVTLFFDDFEGTPVGQLPPGWEVVYSGRGTQYQVVSDAYAYSGIHALQQWGMPGWSAMTRRTFTTDSPVLGHEYAILIDSRVPWNNQEHPAFYGHRAENYWGTYYAVVFFRHLAGDITSESVVPLGTWAARSWYHVRVVLDRTARTYSVWIDGNQVGADLPINWFHPERIDSFAAVSEHAGVPVFYDEVRVFLPAPSEVLGMVRSKVAALQASGVLNAGQAHALTTKLDHAIARLEEGRIPPAVGILRAFINQLSDLVAEGVLTAEQARPLIALAEDILGRLTA